MTVWYTSDTHMGHRNILDYCDRPYSDVAEMDNALVENYCSVVKDTDVVYFLGDIAMGDRKAGLEFIKSMPGKKVLVAGNHDYIHSLHSLKNINKWYSFYADAFDAIIKEWHPIQHWLNGWTVKLSHFPSMFTYEGDKRYSAYRPDVDDVDLLLCGHVHNHWKDVPEHRNVNVGVDVWDYRPVSQEEIIALVESWI